MWVKVQTLHNKQTRSYMSSQEKFKSSYATLNQIADMIGVRQISVMRKVEEGKFPKPVNPGQHRGMLWDIEEITPYIEVWREAVEARQRVKNLVA